eukprot:Amastigsp_a8559_6.p3 type:complete len:111 gc:universal Amastigsp_a8559_6:124-456(+)
MASQAHSNGAALDHPRVRHGHWLSGPAVSRPTRTSVESPPWRICTVGPHWSTDDACGTCAGVATRRSSPRDSECVLSIITSASRHEVTITPQKMRPRLERCRASGVNMNK